MRERVLSASVRRATFVEQVRHSHFATDQIALATRLPITPTTRPSIHPLTLLFESAEQTSCSTAALLGSRIFSAASLASLSSAICVLRSSALACASFAATSNCSIEASARDRSVFARSRTARGDIWSTSPSRLSMLAARLAVRSATTPPVIDDVAVAVMASTRADDSI